jgi:hypothetical protein
VTSTTDLRPTRPRSCPDPPVPRSEPAATTSLIRDGARLWNLYPRIQPADNRYSRIYRGHRELIDHIFVSHVVIHHVTDGQVTAGAPTSPAPESIDDDPNARANACASDHRPLVATIAL